jgi:hypothetical protein
VQETRRILPDGFFGLSEWIAESVIAVSVYRLKHACLSSCQCLAATRSCSGLMASYAMGTQLLQGELERYLDGNRLAFPVFVVVVDRFHSNWVLCFLVFFRLWVWFWQFPTVRPKWVIIHKVFLLMSWWGDC